MCLSTVYYNDDVTKASPLAKNVTAVFVEDDQVVLTDLLGARFAIEGCIERIDLIKNCIIIKPL